MADLLARIPNALPAYVPAEAPLLDFLVDGVSNSDGRSYVDSSRDFAQQFRVGIEGTLVFVDLSLRAAPTDFADGLEWELLGIAGGKPDSNDVITSGPIQTDAFSGVVEWIRVGPLDVPVAAGDALAIALYAVEENSDNYSWLIGAEDDPNGERFCQGLCGDDWGWSSSSDLGIRTYVQPAPEPSAALLQIAAVVSIVALGRSARGRAGTREQP